MKKNLLPKEILFPFVLLTSLFFAWGLANNMTDTLLAAFKKIMSMSDLETSFVQIAFYGAYFCLALPAALTIKRFSYKTGILIGLSMFIVGALGFYPASQTMVYAHFLVSLYVLAGGLSMLETSCNPYIITMGPEETATRRLNLAQSFNPIGSITGVLLSKFFILSNLHAASASDRALMTEEQLAAIQSSELSAMMGPYVGVACVLIVILLLILFTRMPATGETDKSLNIMPTLRRLYKNKKYFWGVIAQFFYVGAQISVWSFTIRYVMRELNVNEEQASSYYVYSLFLFIGARFVFTALMKYFKPATLLIAAAMMAVGSCALAIFCHGMVGVAALVGVSAFMSLMFPTIYGLTITGLGEDTKIGGSGHIMAILGGAVITSFQGQLSDATQSVNLSYLVPLACFVAVAFYGLYIRKREQSVLR